MVLATFVNLPEQKKEVIRQALINEFSMYPLQSAQVARIVKDAGIARGAFYKYFTDLTDAYRYIYKCAMKEIHSGVRVTHEFAPQVFYQSVVDFIEQSQSSKYAQLVRLHVLYNESQVAKPFPQDTMKKLSPQNWSAMVLSHAAIRMALGNPAQAQTVLANFKAGLELLEKGAS